MKATDIFNFRRFGKYFSSDVRTCTANYGLSLLTISILAPVATYAILSGITYIMTGDWNGPGQGTRFFIFAMMMVCMIVTMPVKCYGRLTEKQYGSFWLSLPASRLEKFISMIIISCIIVPIAGFTFYLLVDSLICGIDATCGKGLFALGMDYFRHANEFVDDIGGMLTLNMGSESIPVEDPALSVDILRQLNNPWLYIDDAFGMTLPFLLGAIFFKNGKTVKTLLVMAAIGTAVSMMSLPLMKNYFMEIANSAEADTIIKSMFNNGFFKNIVLIDTVSDTLVNLAFMAGIWFRIKTLKH